MQIHADAWDGPAAAWGQKAACLAHLQAAVLLCELQSEGTVLCLYLRSAQGTKSGTAHIGREAVMRLILARHWGRHARHPGTETPPMVLLTKLGITGIVLMRRKMDGLLIIPLTEIRTNRVRPRLCGAWRVVVTLNRDLRPGRPHRQR